MKLIYKLVIENVNFLYLYKKKTSRKIHRKRQIIHRKRQITTIFFLLIVNILQIDLLHLYLGSSKIYD